MTMFHSDRMLVGFCIQYYASEDGVPLADVFVPTSGLTALACRVALQGRRIPAPSTPLPPSEIQRRMLESPSDFPEVIIINVGGKKPWVVVAMLSAPEVPPLREEERRLAAKHQRETGEVVPKIPSNSPSPADIPDSTPPQSLSALVTGQHESDGYASSSASLLDDVISTNGGARAAVTSDGRMYVTSSTGIDLQPVADATVRIGTGDISDHAALAEPLGEQLKAVEAKVNEMNQLLADLTTRVNEVGAFLSTAVVNPLTQQLNTATGPFLAGAITGIIQPLEVDVEIIKSKVLRLGS